MATIKDVAKAAGVSFKTVSRVVNNDPQVGDALRQRVLRAIEDLDYRPNMSARHMRTQRTQFLGLITDRIATTPFSGDLIKGAQEAAWRHGKILLSINTESHVDIENTAVNMMLERQVEGIVFASMYHRSVNPPEAIRSVPSILLDCYTEDRSLPAVVPDEFRGGLTATEHLLHKGHQRIAVINGKADFPATVGRFAGYQQALRNFGVAFDDNLVRFGGWWQEDGYQNALELMRMPDRPTAIFCGNDRIAMGAYDALRELGLSIPRDAAVVGFDNQEVISAHLKPRLTTIALPYYEMGFRAVESLVQNVSGNVNGSSPEQIRVECSLIVREST